MLAYLVGPRLSAATTSRHRYHNLACSVAGGGNSTPCVELRQFWFTREGVYKGRL